MSIGLKTPPAARERDIFLEALEKSDPKARAGYLDKACGRDSALRQRVEQLLSEEEAVGSFLEEPAISGTPVFSGAAAEARAKGAAVTEKAGDRIGRYKLLQQIGEGGCGVVYMADQEEPVRRRIALKVIKLGMDTKSVIARFEAERQALAMMDHPNIAKVLDAGATETGRPFFVMELVRGIKITDYCDQNKLPTRERLDLFIQVCLAIQHAHQKGVIHRDVKPSNILITLHDGKPVPKVIDFGIAKATEQRLTDKTLFTEFTAFIGTPTYMSPEQAEMSGLDIDTRSDIYSLGVLLYELLTGKTPFDAETLMKASLDECRKTIREKEPVRPSNRVATMLDAEMTTTASQRHTEAPKLISSLQGDLDWIVMKCLEKDRTRRYATANDLAEDVERYLDEEPVSARPPSNIYRLQKLLHRHRGAFTAAAAVILTLVAGAAISGWQAVRATRAEYRAIASSVQEARLRHQAETERERAEQEKSSAHLNEYIADINLAQQALKDGNYGRAMQLLSKHRPRSGEPDLRGFEWRYLWQIAQGDERIPFPNQDGGVQAVAFSPGGDLLAVGTRDKLTIWNVQTRALLKTISRGISGIAFLPDGKTLVASSVWHVRAWNTLDWTEQVILTNGPGFGPPGPGSSAIAVSADGKRMAVAARPDGNRFGGGGRRDEIRILNTVDWQPARIIPEAFGPIAFSPDATRLVTQTTNGLAVWALTSDRPPVLLQDSTNLQTRSDRALSFSLDGKSVVAARNALTERGVFVISIWDAASGKELAVMPNDPDHVEHTGAISAMAFSPDGKTLATASHDHSIRLWDFAKRQPVEALQGHINEVWSLAYSPDGRSIISGAKDGGVNLWNAQRQNTDDAISGIWRPLGFSKDSRTLAALSRDRTVAAVVFLNLRTREPEQQFPLEQSRFGFPTVSLSADFRAMAQPLNDGTVKIWNTETRDTSSVKASERRVDWAILSPNGELMVTGGRNHTLRLWDLAGGTNTALGSDCHRALFSPDGRTLFAFHHRDALQIWDLSGPTLRTNLQSDVFQSDFFGVTAAISADGRFLATSSRGDLENSIKVWDLKTASVVATLIGHKQTVNSICFSSDGKTLATSADDSTFKFWNIASQQELLTIRRLGGTLRDLQFSPDGQMLVGASGFFSQSPSGGLRFYRAPLLSQIDSAR